MEVSALLFKITATWPQSPKNIYDFCDVLENLDYASHQIEYVMNIAFHRRHFKWKIAIPAMFSLCD